VSAFQIFIVRAILAGAFSVLISRIFFNDFRLGYIIGLAVFLVGMSYVSEYLRNRKKG